MGRVWSKAGLLLVSCSTHGMKNLSFPLLFLFFLVPELLGSSMPLCPIDEAIDKKIKQDFNSLCGFEYKWPPEIPLLESLVGME